jgi:hypothetical protein
MGIPVAANDRADDDTVATILKEIVAGRNTQATRKINSLQTQELRQKIIVLKTKDDRRTPVTQFT